MYHGLPIDGKESLLAQIVVFCRKAPQVVGAVIDEVQVVTGVQDAGLQLVVIVDR